MSAGWVELLEVADVIAEQLGVEAGKVTREAGAAETTPDRNVNLIERCVRVLQDLRQLREP